MKRILVIFGTRPEAIKLAPLVKRLQAEGQVDCRCCVTAQHRSMLDQVLEFFEITPEWDLDLMVENQTLAGLTSEVLQGVGRVLREWTPEWVVVQGDTTTTFAASLAAYYEKIPVCHIEAGLRTQNRYSPFPEEGNRRITSVLTDLHMAPTAANRDALLREGIPEACIHVTGNTVVDALECAAFKLGDTPPAELADALPSWEGKPLVLITGHRRESFGAGFERICDALQRLSRMFPGHQFVYPVHLNPNVREPVHRWLGGEGNISLLPPLSYPAFVWMLKTCCLVITDSGGVQEEAPTFGRKVLVMRETTERQEGIEAGTAVLVGTDPDALIAEAQQVLRPGNAEEQLSAPANPYGDGKACERIVNELLREHDG